MKSIFKAVAVITVFSILTRLLGFFFRIFISRKLGAEGLGLYQLSASVLSIFMTLIASGLPLTTAKNVSKYLANGNLKKRNETATASLVIGVVLSLICCAVIWLVRPVWALILTDNTAVDLLLIMTPSLVLSAIYAVLRGVLWGQADFFSCGLTEFLEQIARFIITFFLLRGVIDPIVSAKMSAIAFDLTCLVSAFIVTVIFLKNAKFSFKKGEYRSIIKSASPITGVRLSSSLVQPVTAILLPSLLLLCGYSKSEAVSSFGVMMGMTFPMLFVPMSIIGSISMVLIPSIATMLQKKDYQKINENLTNSIDVSMFISMLFVPLYLSVGNMIGHILFNNITSGTLLQMSAICVPAISMCNLSGSILNSLDMEAKSFKNYIVGSCVLFLTLLLLTPIMGITSIIFAFFLSMLTISILNFKKIKTVVPTFNFNLGKNCLKYSIVVIPCSFIGYFVSKIALNFFIEFFACVIGGGVAMLLTILFAYLLKIYDFNNLIGLIVKKKNKVNN